MTNFLNKRPHKTLYLKHINQAMTANLKHDLVLETGLSFFKLLCRKRRFFILHYPFGENWKHIRQSLGLPSSAISIFFSHIESVLLVFNRLFCILNINMHAYIWYDRIACVDIIIDNNSWRSIRLSQETKTAKFRLQFMILDCSIYCSILTVW